MRFSDEVFVGKSIRDLGTIIYSLKRNIPVLNLYCICIDRNSNNLIEILSSYELYKERNIKKNYFIIGVAQGKREAYDLSVYVFQFCVDNKWDFKNFKENIINYKG